MNIPFKVLKASAEGSRSQTMDSLETGGPSDSIGREIPFPGSHLTRRDGHLQAAFARAQRIFRPLALHKLAKLSTDMSKHFQKIIVRLGNLTAKTLHHADHFVADFDGKTDAGVQALLDRRRRARKITVVGHVANPLWFAAAPDSPRQTYARRKLGPAGEGFELGYADRGKAPKVHTGQ